MLRCVFVFFWLSLPAQADDQSTSAAEIERLSNTFGFEGLLASRHPQTAILLDGCLISFIEYFGNGYAVIVTDDLSLISLKINNNGDFMDSQRTDADWLALYFATSATGVRTDYFDIPSQPSPREIVASEPRHKSRTDWARYLNYWYPETVRVETISEALIAYQSDFCKPIT